MKVVANLLLLIFVLQACSAQSGAKIYAESGLSLSVPEEWVFSGDTNFTNLGDRAVSFLTGEFSYFALYVIRESDSASYRKLSLSEYLDKNLHSAKPAGLGKDKFKVTRFPVAKGLFSGFHYDIESHFIEKTEIEVDAFMFDVDKAKIIVVFETEKNLVSDVSKSVHRVLSSIEYRYLTP